MYFPLGDSGSAAQTLWERDWAVTDREGKGICLGGERNQGAKYNTDLPENNFPTESGLSPRRAALRIQRCERQQVASSFVAARRPKGASPHCVTQHGQPLGPKEITPLEISSSSLKMGRKCYSATLVVHTGSKTKKKISPIFT